ncbi:Ribonuclease PH [Rickettsiales endosymbiont of Paramecium tredecaurelia]|uniref:ribonuclease PH n=1 Tax=Candidatus Sarmatiella mevalonica TaxID=2770581 RepID=UPI00192336EB|nr:ribonuclease PH [Candidatus Sarmatiella mevalonica]MBL3285169.1 Ribonuclease PH [Candidatus Sarmatiella mevalonica]
MKQLKRLNNRKYNEAREIIIKSSPLINVDTSCMVCFGNTHVVCSAMWDTKVPHFLRGSRSGWITAEYGMLPNCSTERIQRESASGKISGRSQEIQRLIGRTLRSSVHLEKLPEGQILLDCDVINADGGTRTAAISGAYVALVLLLRSMLKKQMINSIPIAAHIAAISCGIVGGSAVLDLNYSEDSSAVADANFVLDKNFNIVEIQAAAERGLYSIEQFLEMMELAKIGVQKIVEQQNLFLQERCGLSFVEQLERNTAGRKE